MVQDAGGFAVPGLGVRPRPLGGSALPGALGRSPIPGQIQQVDPPWGSVAQDTMEEFIVVVCIV